MTALSIDLRNTGPRRLMQPRHPGSHSPAIGWPSHLQWRLRIAHAFGAASTPSDVSDEQTELETGSLKAPARAHPLSRAKAESRQVAKRSRLKTAGA
jgi:hypothetical protein